MNLYLMQHGEAVSKEVDPERPLSGRGRQEVGKVARFAAEHCRLNTVRILHSGKLRARQTAEILTEYLDLPAPLETDGLAPLDDPGLWARRCHEREESILLVGHLPHLARLTGALLCGTPDSAPVKFRMGGMVALAREEGLWALQWMLVPSMLAG